MPSLDYGRAYEMGLQETQDHLRQLRSEGSRALQYVPGLGRTVAVWDLDDDEIQACAIFDAEKSVNMAISMRNAAERYNGR